MDDINNMVASSVPTKRRGRKLVRQEYVFRMDKKIVNDVTSWKCGCSQKDKPYHAGRNRRLTDLVYEYLIDHDGRKLLDSVSYNYLKE